MNFPHKLNRSYKKFVKFYKKKKKIIESQFGKTIGTIQKFYQTSHKLNTEKSKGFVLMSIS